MTAKPPTPDPEQFYAGQKATCGACRRVRKLYRVKPGHLQYSDYKWHRLCAECVKRVFVNGELPADIRRSAPKKPAGPRKAYPCIGGPLAGEHATTGDFRRAYPHKNPIFNLEAGMYAHLAGEYWEYNSAGSGDPSMVFIHDSLLQPTISPRKR